MRRRRGRYEHGRRSDDVRVEGRWNKTADAQMFVRRYEMSTRRCVEPNSITREAGRIQEGIRYNCMRLVPV